MLTRALLILTLICSSFALQAQIISTVAGKPGPVQNYSGDGGPATNAEAFPYGVGVDKVGNIYIADQYFNVIRKVNPAGIISTFAGNGASGNTGDGGPATAARLSAPHAVAIDPAGNVFIGCVGKIRKVDPAGIISTYAGVGTLASSGDGGPATAAEFGLAVRMALDGNGNLYFTDCVFNRVRKIDANGVISTVAGNGSAVNDGDGGPATSAGVNHPVGLAVDVLGNLFISCNNDDLIRKVSTTGIISTIAGTGTRGYSGDGGQATSATFFEVNGIQTDTCGNLYLADMGNDVIRMIDPLGIVTTIAGNHTRGYSGDGGPALAAQLSNPMDLAFGPTGNLFIAENENRTIRKVTNVAKPYPKVAIGNRTDASCFGACDGSATAIVSGGTAPFIFSWSNGSTSNPGSGLCAGIDTVTVTDANSCQATDTVIINEPALISSTVNKTICDNDSIYLGSLWRKTAGSYLDTVLAQNGCDSVITIILSLKPAPTATITGVADICTGSNTSLTGSGAPFLLWSTGETAATITVSPAVTSTFVLTATSGNGCEDKATITVVIRPNPTANIGSSTSPTCPGSQDGSVSGSASSGSSPYTYNWNSTPAQYTPTALHLGAGNYQFTVTDQFGCTGTKSITLTDPAAINYSFVIGSTSCNSATGSIAITVLSGGSSPFEYSVDGGAFQSSANFGSLSSGLHSVSVRDVFLCQVDRTFNVGTTSGPSNFSLGSSNASCGISNGSISCTSVIGGTGPFQYQLNAGSFQSDSNFTGLAATNYTVTVKDNNGCTFSMTAVINSGTGINGFNINSGAETCQLKNGVIQVRSVNGGTAPYTYSINGLPFQADSNFVSLDSGHYMITVKDALGCTRLDSIDLFNYGGIDSVNVSSTSATCSNSNGAVSFSIYGSSGPFSTSLNSGPFLSQSSYSSLPSGNDSVLVKDQYGCTFKKLFTISNIAGPSSFTVSTIQPGCSQNNGRITITGISGGTAPYEYKYDTAGAVFNSNTVFSTLYSGVHHLMVRDANGCLFAINVILSNPPGPSKLSVSTTPEDCGQNNGTLMVTGVTGGFSPYSYRFNGGPLQSSVSESGLDSGNYQVSVYDKNNCSFDSAFRVSYNSGPQSMLIDYGLSSCGLANGGILVTTVNGGSSPYSYSLNGSVAQSGNGFGGLLTGSHQVTVYDKGGCRKDSTVFLGDQPGPDDMTAALTRDTCLRNTGVISLTSISNGTRPFSFSIDGGAASLNDTVFSGLSKGDHIVLITDTNGCTYSETFFIDSVKTPKQVDTTIFESHCFRSDGALTIVDPQFFHGGTPPYSYTVGSVTNPPAYTFTGFAQGNYMLIITDKSNCQYFQPFTIPHIDGPTDCQVDLHPTTCSQSNGWIYVHDVVGGSDPFDYEFSIDSVNFIPGGAFPFTMHAGSYRLIVKDQYNCTYGRDVYLPDIPGPTDITFNTVDEHCDQKDGIVKNISGIGGTPPVYYYLDNTIVNFGEYPGLSAGSYQLKATDLNGCEFSKQVNINAAPRPEAEFTQSETEGEDPIIVAFTNKSIQADNYKWDFGDGTYSTLISPTHEYQVAGELNIMLTASDAFGCVDTAYGHMSITPVTSVFIPNAFTPDGDGINDIFQPVMFNQQKWELEIFDRWGESVVHLDQDHPSWDGTYKGSAAATAVFSYRLISRDIFGKKTSSTGQIDLIR